MHAIVRPTERAAHFLIRLRPMSLGARLTRLRLEKGESLQQVAEAVGVSKAHVWELEKGRTDNPSMALVTRLADHFGLSLATLVGENPLADDAKGEIGRMFRQAGELEPEDLALLDDMMQSLLKRRRKSEASDRSSGG
jgi:transcriptional regulator with XRE-family HTH domain